MAFDNRDEHDDKYLIQMLKAQAHDIPAVDLADRVMNKFESMKREGRFSYKPLNLPVYLMLVIALLMITPFLVPVASDISIDSVPQPINTTESSIVVYVVFSWLAIATLLVSVTIFQRQLKLFKQLR
jgi:hypothetical protein